MKYKIKYIVYKYFPIIIKPKEKLLNYFHIDKEKSININTFERIEGHVRKLEKNKNLEYNLDILNKIIEICRKKDIKLILLTTPFKKEYNNYFNDNLLNKNFYNIINQITKENKLLYFDFSHDYVNFDKEEYFQDFDHLSESGSYKFIEVLKNKLKENRIEVNF